MSRRQIAIVFCVLAGACGGMTPRIAPATDDATLTVRVRTALLNDPAVHANAAITAAQRIEGVRDVQSELQPSR